SAAALFEQMFNEYKGLVYRTAYSVVRSHADADDVVQHVFTSLLLRGFSPDSMSNVKGYLYRAAIRQARLIQRVRGRRGFAEADIDSVPQRTTAPEDAGIHEELQQAMAQLKDDAVELLLLRYQEDLPEAEIARVLGKSRPVVAMSLLRSRRRLKKLL